MSAARRPFLFLFFLFFFCFYSALIISRNIERVSKCVDFCLSLYAVHLVACAFSFGFPGNWEWWALHIGSAVALTELTAFVTARLESEEIVMPYHSSQAPRASSTHAGTSDELNRGRPNRRSIEHVPLLEIETA
jgi:hypothetical protein